MKTVGGFMMAIGGALVAVVALSATGGAAAQRFQPNEKEAASAMDPGYEHSGTVGEASYSYNVDLSGVVTLASVDGPAPAYGGASEDPDRWVILPKRDAMTDVTRWYMTHYQTGLMLSMSRAGNIVSACVIGADFPGRPVAIRVGEKPAIRMAEDCDVPPPALKANLIAGGRLLVRGYKWPNDFPVDKTGSASTFASALKLYLYLRQQP